MRESNSNLKKNQRLHLIAILRRKIQWEGTGIRHVAREGGDISECPGEVTSGLKCAAKRKQTMSPSGQNIQVRQSEG